MPGNRDVEITLNLGAADDLADDVLERGIRATTLDAEGLVKDLYSQPGRGRVYRRNGTTHRASAPGDSPAPDTGNLRNSVGSEVVRTPLGPEGRVIVSAEYALPLEVGTERIAARPTLSRVANEFGARLMATFLRFTR